MNVKLSIVCPLLLVLAFVGCSTTEPAATAPDGVPVVELPSRHYDFTYTVTVPVTPGTKTLDIWIPLPRDDDGVQQVSDLEIDAPYGYQITTEPVHGNRMIYCRVNDPTGPVKCSWSARILRREDRGQGTLPTASAYLEPNALIPLEGTAEEIAVKLGANDTSRDLHVRARAIYDDVLDGMEYDKKVAGYGMGDFNRAVTVCKGNCTDFHSRFIGVARAAGIPVRFTMGVPMKPVPSGTYNSYHCWAHYHDGTNWHPVDISEADKVVATDPEKARWYFRHVGQDRLSLTFGRDLILSPPQNGAPLNYFVFPYAEADGKAVEMGKKDWVFTYEDV